MGPHRLMAVHGFLLPLPKLPPSRAGPAGKLQWFQLPPPPSPFADSITFRNLKFLSGPQSSMHLERKFV